MIAEGALVAALLWPSACSQVSIEGIDGMPTVRSAVALDLRAEDVLVLGQGRVGTLVASSILLSSEADWCVRERARLDRVAALGARAAARLAEDPTLCDAEIAEELRAIDAAAHDAERRTFSFDVCAAPDCAWSDVPVREKLAVPWDTGDVTTFGRYVVRTERGLPATAWWDEDTCGVTAAYAEEVASLTEVWTVADGSLTFDRSSDGGAASGSFAGVLEAARDDSPDGTVEGTFHATPCVLDVPVYLSL